MSENILYNGVKESGASYEDLSPVRCPIDEQCGPGRHQNTAGRIRRKWSQRDYKSVMECFYRIDPKKGECRKRKNALWIGKRIFNVTEQRLMNQKA